MNDSPGLWQRAAGAIRRRHVRDIRSLDARDRLGHPPKPYLLGVATFVLVLAMGFLVFAVGRSDEQTAYLLIAGLGIFGLATAIGFSLVIAQYRMQQDLDTARSELLTVHADLALERREIDACLHDAKAMVAAISATLHKLEASGDQAEATALLQRQVDLLRSFLSRTRLSPEPISLIDLIEDLRPVADAHEVVMEIDIEPDVEVLADRQKAGQILENLIDNARKHAAGSPIEISTRPAGPFVRVLFEDRGPGLSGIPETLFAPGTRSGGETQGFGMGLANARRLAEAMGGSCWYEPRPGGGSSFVLKLERAPGDAPSGPDTP